MIYHKIINKSLSRRSPSSYTRWINVILQRREIGGWTTNPMDLDYKDFSYLSLLSRRLPRDKKVFSPRFLWCLIWTRGIRLFMKRRFWLYLLLFRIWIIHMLSLLLLCNYRYRSQIIWTLRPWKTDLRYLTIISNMSLYMWLLNCQGFQF